MSAENGDGGGFWNKLKSFIGISSTEKPTQYADDGSEILDEVVVSANRKPNWVQRNFSKDKLVNDWKNIKERSGANHLVNWFKNQNYDGGYYMYDDSGEASGDQSLKKQPHPTKPLEAINVGGFTQAGSFAKVGVGIGNIKSVAAPMNAVNNTLSGMSLGASTVEPTKELINSVKVWLFNGAQDSTLINLTPEQNMKLRDYQSIEGHRFRDSLKKESYFNTYK